ncbi:hemolysin family protein [Williamsia sp. CHRR-6]|uniref:hemolysin family protein n=1 Tax=Williamsia sp. CHRR-6 TaxID=2835871 RepID=UPI001BD92EF6|nr:hemolysin family protein [Williamsia sp. CHRR-6]MBT0567788.1 HlyC/CorC family transporter [Williamsia sp. CHRR-6]
MVEFLGVILGLLAVIAITGFTGYFVAQEFAYMAVDRSRLAAAATAGDTSATRALAVTKRTSFMLSGAQLGITVTGLLVGYVAEPLIGSGVGRILGDISIAGVSMGTATGVAFGAVIAVVASTVIQMLLGELFPKNLAIAVPDPLARRLAPSTLIYMRVFGPLIALFDRSAEALLRVLRIEAVHDVDQSATPEDLIHIVALSRNTGDIDPTMSIMLDRIIDFPDRTVEHAMTPRAVVATMSPETTIEQAREQMTGGHTRYPVVDEALNVVGVVSLHDVLDPARDVADGTARTVADVARPPLVLPQSVTLPVAEQEMVTAGVQFAVIIDEYGDIAGILTDDDIVEEWLGELADEHDEKVPTAPVGRGEWTVAGHLPVDELSRLVGFATPEGDYETVAGLAISAAQRLLQPGDVVEVELPEVALDYAHRDDPVRRQMRLTVVSVARRVPSQLTVSLSSSPDGVQP